MGENYFKSRTAVRLSKSLNFRIWITKLVQNHCRKRLNISPFPIVMCEVDHQLIEERWYDLEKKGYLNTFTYFYVFLVMSCLSSLKTEDLFFSETLD